MKGTEKQIAWAEDIRRNVISTFQRYIEEIKNYDAPEEIKSANIGESNRRVDALNGAEYAGDIIDLFKDIRFTGDIEKDFPKVVSVYRITRPNTPGQKTILCK